MEYPDFGQRASSSTDSLNWLRVLFTYPACRTPRGGNKQHALHVCGNIWLRWSRGGTLACAHPRTRPPWPRRRADFDFDFWGACLRAWMWRQRETRLFMASSPPAGLLGRSIWPSSRLFLLIMGSIFLCEPVAAGSAAVAFVPVAAQQGCLLRDM